MDITTKAVSLSHAVPASPVIKVSPSLKESGATSEVAAKSADVRKKSEPVTELGPSDRALEQINKLLKTQQQALEFSLDKGSNRVVYKLIDTNTGEVIRQIPSEEFLSLSRSLAAKTEGALLRDKA